MHPSDDRTFTGFAGDDRSRCHSLLAVVQSQVALPFIPILTVAVKAIFRQDGANIAIEVKRLIVGLKLAECEKNDGDENPENGCKVGRMDFQDTKSCR